jgi:Protein of unknown function (DUF2489)
MSFVLYLEEAMVVNGARERGRQIASGVLAGDIHVLEAAIALCPLLRSDPTIASKDDANLMVALASEIDHLPIGRVREEWHPDFLPEKDQEVARFEKLSREEVRSACERILMQNSAGPMTKEIS